MAKIYLSGKITGIESEAPALFEAVEKMLISHGHEVVNPITLAHDHDKSYAAYMKADIRAMCDCDTIFMLANYNDSPGAWKELEIAKTIGLSVLYQKTYKV